MSETREPACGACRHWHRADADPADLGAPRGGECRLNPPAAFPVRDGLSLRMLSGYVQVPADCPACSHFAPELKIRRPE